MAHFQAFTFTHQAQNILNTLIECSNTLIEQPDNMATETRMSIIMGIIGYIQELKKELWENFLRNSGRNNR